MQFNMGYLPNKYHPYTVSVQITLETSPWFLPGNKSSAGKNSISDLKHTTKELHKNYNSIDSILSTIPDNLLLSTPHIQCYHTSRLFV